MSSESVRNDVDARLGFVRGRPRPMARLRDWQRNVAMWPSTVWDQGKAVCFLCRLTEYPPEDTATFLYPTEWYSVDAEQEGSQPTISETRAAPRPKSSRTLTRRQQGCVR